MLALPVAALALTLLVHTIINYDLWWHLAAGRYIVRQGRLPYSDPFSYISPKDEVWNDHEWLFQVVAYGFERGGGAFGLTFLQTAAIGMGLAFLFFGARRVVWPAAYAALLVAVSLSSERFMVRAEMVSLMMIPLYVFALNEYVYGRRSFALKLLPAAQIVWANSHPGHIIGLALVGAYACGETIPALMRKATKKRAWRLWGVLVLCLCGALLNPYGMELIVHPIRQTHSRAFMQGITEWQSPFVRTEHPSAVLSLFKGYLALMGLLFVFNVRRLRVFELLVVFGMGWAACMSRRHFAVFALASAPVFARWLGNVLQGREAWRMWARRALGAGVVAASIAGTLAVVTNRFYVHEGTPKEFGVGLAPSQFPGAAIQFVRQHSLRGNMFNNYDVGGYISWRCYPSRLVFFDGRNFVYKEGLYKMYRRSLSDWSAWQRMAERCGFEYVLLKHSSQGLGVLLPSLWASPRWHVVHVDPVGIVFVKAGGLNAALPAIDKTAFAPPQAPACAEQRRDLVISFPHEQIAMGRLCQGLGMLDLAIEWYRIALRVYPYIGSVYNDLGVIFSLKGRHEEAIEYLRWALALNPRLSSAHLNLGIEYVKLREWDRALRSLSEAVRGNPRNAKAHHNLAVVLAQRGRIDEAIMEFHRAINLNARYLLPRYALARVLITRRQWEEAEAVCRRILTLYPGDAEAKRLLTEIERGR